MGKFLVWILPENITAITLYPFGMYYRDELDSFIVQHEHVHWMQQREMLCLFFYLWYMVEWLIKLISHGRGAYYLISFEQEAYNNSWKPYYADNRKHYSWLKYVL